MTVFCGGGVGKNGGRALRSRVTIFAGWTVTHTFNMLKLARCPRARFASVQATDSVASTRVRPFEDIPTAKMTPAATASLLFNILRGKPPNFVNMMNSAKESYGNIFKVSRGPILSTTVLRPEDVEAVFRIDGKVPIREGLPIWTDAMKSLGKDLTLFHSQGPQWLAQRGPMSKYLMMPRLLHQYTPELNVVVRDLLETIERQKKDGGHRVDDVLGILHAWAFESTAQFVLGKKLDVLRNFEDLPEDTAQFIQSVQDTLESTAMLVLQPPLYKIYPTKTWKKLLASFNGSSKYCAPIVNERLREVENALRRGEEGEEGEVKLDLMSFLLKNTSWSPTQVVDNAVDLLGAGIDTTSNTLLFTLYQISINPSVQERLRADIYEVIGGADRHIKPEHISKLPLLKNCVTEAQRMYPVIVGTFRRLQQDTVLSGYSVPAGTQVQMNSAMTANDPQFVDNPTMFDPDRWVKGSTSSVHPFASFPFGFGARGCIGKRLAEFELRIALAKILQRYRVEFPDPTPLGVMTKIFLFPDRKVSFNFHPV